MCGRASSRREAVGHPGSDGGGCREVHVRDEQDMADSKRMPHTDTAMQVLT